jgi:hypothetical protein
VSTEEVSVASWIEIARPRVAVADYAADPDNATDWYENIETVQWRSPRPLAVGSRIAFVAAFLGRRIAYTYEVREHVPGELRDELRHPGPCTSISRCGVCRPATRRIRSPPSASGNSRSAISPRSRPPGRGLGLRPRLLAMSSLTPRSRHGRMTGKEAGGVAQQRSRASEDAARRHPGRLERGRNSWWAALRLSGADVRSERGHVAPSARCAKGVLGA